MQLHCVSNGATSLLYEPIEMFMCAYVCVRYVYIYIICLPV